MARALALLVSREGRRLERLQPAPCGLSESSASRVQSWKKSSDEIVTALDRETETRLARALAKFPVQADFLGEESAFSKFKDPGGAARSSHSKRSASVHRSWVVDPIDGTTNFAAGMPAFGIAVALLENGEPLLAACYERRLRATLFAAAGAGAWMMGGSKHQHSRRVRLQQKRGRTGRSLSPTDLLGVQWTPSPGVVPPLLAAASTLGCKLRVPGSAVTQTLSVALGESAVAILERVKVWDVAAAAFIAQEAGATVLDFEGQSLFPFADSIFRDTQGNHPVFVARPGLGREILQRLLDLRRVFARH